MFLLLENEFVILGPMEWRPNFFASSILDEYELEVSLPKTNNERLPIQINETFRILPVSDIGIEGNYNPRTQFLSGPFYHFFSDRAEMYHVPMDKPLDYFKGELKAEVADSRWRYENKGFMLSIQDQDVYIYTTKEDRTTYLQAYQLGVNNVNWKFREGFLNLSSEDLGRIVVAGASYIQDVFNWEASKVESIDGCQTLEELELIETFSSDPDWEPPKRDRLNV